MVEFAIAMLLLGGILSSMLFYTWQYLETDEKAIAAKSLELGRYSVIPPLLTQANAGKTVPLPKADLATALSTYIQRAFVVKAPAKLSGGCAGTGDFRAFLDEVDCTNAVTGCVLSDHAGGTQGLEFDCNGNIVDVSSDPIPAEIAEEARAKGTQIARGAGKLRIVVVYSRGFPELGSLVYAAEASPIFPTLAYSFYGY